MYEYKFVKLKLSSFLKNPEQDYHAVITEHAHQGWRLKQIFAPPISGYGVAKFYELIFERKL